MIFSLNSFMPQVYVYSFSLSLSLFSLFQFFLYIFYYYYYYYIVVYVYVSSTCTDLVEKRIRFPQSSSLVLYLYFRIFYFCIVELWVLVNLKYRKKNMSVFFFYAKDYPIKYTEVFEREIQPHEIGRYLCVSVVIL